ncbi:MAG: DUF4340 domain-containing protein [Deltaproteobacteria bacterium]|nr:DUF4340 domain-containing protein [Deltaproteobacteria bacterium]
MSKQSLIAIAVFALLLGGVWLVNQQPAEKGISRISFAKVDPDAIDRLEVEGPEAVTLIRSGEGWKVDGKHRASKSAVDSALSVIPKITSSALITANPERFADYEVDAEKGNRVKASAGGKVVAEFVVGKAAEGGTHVRVGDEVFSVSGIYAYTFVRKTPQWYELKVFEEKIDALSRVALGPVGAPFALEKAEEAWRLAAEPAPDLPEGFRFDPAAAKSRVAALVNLRAKELVTEDPGVAVTGLGEGAARVSFTAGEQTRTLRLGQAAGEGGAVYGQVEGGDTLYLLHASNAEAFLAPVESLRLLDLMDFDPSIVRSLEIVDGAERTLLEKGEAGWAITESRPALADDFVFDPARVDQRLAALKNARALGLAEGEQLAAAEQALKKPVARVVLTFESGQQAELDLGAEQESEEQKWIPARGNIDAGVYRLSPFLRRSLAGGGKSFEKVEAPAGPGMGPMGGLDPETLKNLPPEVREALMKKMMEQQQLQQLQAKIPAGE